MKKLYSSVLAIGLFLGASAQTTLTYKTHALRPGDSHQFTMANPVEVGPDGANQYWDYSNLVPNSKSLTSYMLLPSQTEKSAGILADNTVLEEYGNQFFFKVTESGMEQYGTASCNNVYKYDKPFVKLQFPFTYGDSYTGTFSGILESGNGNKTDLNGIYDVEADAYGTLLLPGDVELENVLRVKTIRTHLYASGESSIITYRWYTNGVRYPVLVIIQNLTSTGANTSTVAYHSPSNLKSGAVLLSESAAENNDFLNVYPNPYKDMVNVEYNLSTAGNVNIELYDAMGRLVKTLLDEEQTSGSQKISFSTKEYGFSSGLYYIKINHNGNSEIRKIVELD